MKFNNCASLNLFACKIERVYTIRFAYLVTQIQLSYRPRASSVAERLWSDAAQTNSTGAAFERLHNHRCRMLRYADIV